MKVVGEGVLPSPVRSFAWSPTIDLCVFVMAKEVSAHRLSGQKVWTISSHSLQLPDVEFTHVAWRDDGMAAKCRPYEQAKSSQPVSTTGPFTYGMYKMDAKFVK